MDDTSTSAVFRTMNAKLDTIESDLRTLKWIGGLILGGIIIALIALFAAVITFFTQG